MIRNLFNLITAWASVVLLILVIIIWILRILVQKHLVSKCSLMYRANRTLRKYHKLTGIAFLIIALIHGILSSAKILSINWGSASLLLILIMCLSYLIKNKLQRKTWLNIHRVLTVLVAVTFIVHLLDVGISGLGLLRVPAAAEEYELSQNEITDLQEETIDDSSEIAYEDGVYTGTADGFGPDLTVEVTIENNVITNIVVVSHNEENERYWGTAVEQIPEAIVEAQSVEVDSVSGATYTSIGIKNAVLDALSQAIIQGELPETEKNPNGGGHGNGRYHNH